MQYREYPSQLSAAKFRQISEAQIIFTTRKMKTCLPSLKTSFARKLRSKVAYKLTCSGCNSTYVGQTVRHLATRIDEYRKRVSPIGQHLLECNKEVGGSAELKSEIIDQTEFLSPWKNKKLKWIITNLQENVIIDYVTYYVITVV